MILIFNIVGLKKVSYIAHHDLKYLSISVPLMIDVSINHLPQYGSNSSYSIPHPLSLMGCVVIVWIISYMMIPVIMDTAMTIRMTAIHSFI